jgi:hypothetical protein
MLRHSLPFALAFCACATRVLANDCSIDVDKELWIRDLSVIDDPVRTTYVQNPPTPSHGAWTFGRLIENMAGPNDPSDFCLHLFKQFAQTQTVNGFVIDPRPGMLAEVIQPWIEQSEENGFKGLDFSIAPFLLTGIVNRIDLRGNGNYGTPTSGGEGRIVFTAQVGGSSTRMTVIFEYELVASSCEEVKQWAHDWHALGSIPFGPAYNEALEKIVDRFAGKNAAPHKVNGSALNQFRTNELVAEFPWQWREFHLSAATTLLEQGTVAQTPATILNQTKAIRDYVNQNEAAILNGTHVVPLVFANAPFRGGASDGDPNGNGLTAHFRAAGINNNDARHIFSLNTCVACHTEETNTNFFQAFRGGPGFPTFLSEFLTGEVIPDPVDPTVSRHFNDLKRRVEDLCHLLTVGCDDLASEKPFLRVH